MAPASLLIEVRRAAARGSPFLANSSNLMARQPISVVPGQTEGVSDTLAIVCMLLGTCRTDILLQGGGKGYVQTGVKSAGWENRICIQSSLLRLC